MFASKWVKSGLVAMRNINRLAGVKAEGNLMKIYHMQVVNYIKAEQECWQPQKRDYCLV